MRERERSKPNKLDSNAQTNASLYHNFSLQSPLPTIYIYICMSSNKAKGFLCRLPRHLPRPFPPPSLASDRERTSEDLSTTEKDSSPLPQHHCKLIISPRYITTDEDCYSNICSVHMRVFLLFLLSGLQIHLNGSSFIITWHALIKIFQSRSLNFQ